MGYQKYFALSRRTCALIDGDNFLIRVPGFRNRVLEKTMLADLTAHGVSEAIFYASHLYADERRRLGRCAKMFPGFAVKLTGRNADDDIVARAAKLAKGGASEIVLATGDGSLVDRVSEAAAMYGTTVTVWALTWKKASRTHANQIVDAWMRGPRPGCLSIFSEVS